MSAFTCNNPQKAESFKEQYAALRAGYHGLPVTEDQQIDTELVSSIISRMEKLQTLMACHLNICIIVTNLYRNLGQAVPNNSAVCSYIPVAFRYSYIVPIPKPKEFVSKALTCDDFRGIAISPVISKIFEHCILKRFGSFLTSHNQFGF